MDTLKLVANDTANPACSIFVLDGAGPNPVQDYVESYRSFLSKTADAILGLARTLVNAEAELEPAQFSAFCKEVGLEIHGSTYKKLKKIGESEIRFLVFKEQLPPTWTTLYSLAKLDAGSFDRVSSHLTPFITAKQINDILRPAAPVSKKRDTRVDIDLSMMDDDTAASIMSALQALKVQFNFKMRISSPIDFKKAA